jgi:2-methylisocitrate lyase-like PEP mutase family enzyme
MDDAIETRPSRSQADKGAAFRSLHRGERAFVLPNPWDRGSARLLAGLGFPALATTSAGYAFSRGRCDGRIAREEMMAHAAEIVAATDLPVSADLENGFGDAPEIVAETIRMAARVGLCGASIEDSGAAPRRALYDIDLATDRIRAAAEVCRGLPTPFVLTARAENFLVGRPDLRDTIHRLQVYQEAGADVLYAPGLRDRRDIAAVVAAVDRPVNVVMGLGGARFSVDELSDLGVKRISVGSALARAAYGTLLRAGREMSENGTFDFAVDAVAFAEISARLSG